MGEMRWVILSVQDHETRLRKIETRLQRGVILAALLGSGIAGNAKAEQIAEFLVKFLSGG